MTMFCARRDVTTSTIQFGEQGRMDKIDMTS
jgi:hypothetical protein